MLLRYLLSLDVNPFQEDYDHKTARDYAKLENQLYPCYILHQYEIEYKKKHNLNVDIKDEGSVQKEEEKV